MPRITKHLGKGQEWVNPKTGKQIKIESAPRGVDTITARDNNGKKCEYKREFVKANFERKPPRDDASAE